jgi:hypothetical protein
LSVDRKCHFLVTDKGHNGALIGTSHPKLMIVGSRCKVQSGEVSFNVLHFSRYAFSSFLVICN